MRYFCCNFVAVHPANWFKKKMAQAVERLGSNAKWKTKHTRERRTIKKKTNTVQRRRAAWTTARRNVSSKTEFAKAFCLLRWACSSPSVRRRRGGPRAAFSCFVKFDVLSFVCVARRNVFELMKGNRFFWLSDKTYRARVNRFVLSLTMVWVPVF